MTKEEIEKLKETVAYFGHWYDVIGLERVLILERSIDYISYLEKELAISEHDREHNDEELVEVYKKVEQLEKENAELKSRDCWKSCEYAYPKSELIGQHIKDVQNLTKATELLNEFMRISKASDEDFEHDYSELIAEAEQFLKG